MTHYDTSSMQGLAELGRQGIKRVGGERSRYRIHAAAVEPDGLRLNPEPRATARTLRQALALAADPANHGPEGAAIVTPAGRTIYTAEEYTAAHAKCAGEATPGRVVIDRERYGERSEFRSLRAAQRAIRSCGGDFTSVTFSERDGRVVDDRGEVVGEVR